MNLEFQSKKSLKYLRQEVIPLLVLIEQWSKSGQSALIKTNEILMLLDVLHLTLTKTQQEFTLELLIQHVEKVINVEGKNTFVQSLQLISTDCCRFFNLFKNLTRLIEKPKVDTSVMPLIDSNNGVLGLFLKHCCQEFEKLTFSQVVLFHRQWNVFVSKSFDNIALNIKKSNKEKLSEAKKERNFTSALQVLTYSEHGNASVELKALHLAMLLAHFDHIKESSKALQEAICLAQLNENDLVLRHSLALLKRLQPTTPYTTHQLMDQFVKNASLSHQELLKSTGKLQLVQLDILLNVEPKNVLSSIVLSQYDVFNSNEDYAHKIAIRSSSLLLQASSFCQYNLNPLSYMTLQLICHMIPIKQGHDSHYVSDLSKAIQMVAKLLYNQGHLSLAISLLECSIKKLSFYDKTGRITQILKCSLAELHAEEALLLCNWSNVSENIAIMRIHDDLLASYWSVNLLYHKRLYKIASIEIEKLLSELQQSTMEVYSFKIKLQLLLADIYYAEQNYSYATEVLLSVLACCQEYNLLLFQVFAKLKLAQSQLGLSLVDQCNQTLVEILPDVMRNGHCTMKAQSYLLLAQITLTKSLQSNNFILPQDCQKALKYLDYAMSELQPQLTQSLLMKHVLMLQGFLCHGLSSIKEQ